MPRGTRHTLTGTLRWTGREFALEIDDGGVWRLDVGAKANRSVGHRVTVEGVRTGFDLLDVNRLIDNAYRAGPWWSKLFPR